MDKLAKPTNRALFLVSVAVTGAFAGAAVWLFFFVMEHGITIPPLVNAYMSLSPTMRLFGTAVNHEFGEVEETGIFFKIDEIAEQKKSRHIDTFQKDSVK